MEETLFKIINQVKNTLKAFGDETDLDLLKGLKITLTDNAVTIKIMVNNLEMKEEN